MSKISIVIPVYKVEQYLRRCIDSVIRQTLTDFDLILVDDGSPDRCGEICDMYAQKDQRITAIHQKNGGLSAARNSGIEWALQNSNSEWITFIDSDDWIHPCYLEYLYNAVKQTGCSIAIGGFEKTTDKAFVEGSASYDAKIVQTEQFYVQNKVWGTVAWGKLYPKVDFAELRYPCGLIHEDEFTTYKVLFRYEQLAVVAMPLYAYYQNPQSIMGSQWNPKHIAEPEAMKAQIAFFQDNSYLSARQYLARLYLFSLYRQMQGAGNGFPECQKSLKKELRRGLLTYGKLAEVHLWKESWLFFAAFPVATAPYRLWKKLFRVS